MSYDPQDREDELRSEMQYLWIRAPDLPKADRRACRQRASQLQREQSPDPARVVKIVPSYSHDLFWLD